MQGSRDAEILFLRVNVSRRALTCKLVTSCWLCEERFGMHFCDVEGLLSDLIRTAI